LAGQKIAFLGTGLMGAPMARNLIAAGHAVTVWNRTHAKAEALVADGATLASTPADAVADCTVAIAIVSNGAAVADLLFDAGVAEAMPEASVFIDMSSVTPAEARHHAARLSAHGVAQLDAPVSGGTKGAAAATLAIMAGGEKSVFERVRPVLEAMWRPVLVGPSGAGQLAKLANQAIVGVTIGVVAEATLLMQAGGGDVDAFRDALKGGFADSIILQQHGRRMATGDFEPGARSSIQLKDMINIAAEADKLGIRLPLASQVRERFDALVNELDGADLDHSALYVELKRRAQKH
jgi:2-hydroxy-3-oxopropionate reductase